MAFSPTLDAKSGSLERKLTVKQPSTATVAPMAAVSFSVVKQQPREREREHPKSQWPQQVKNKLSSEKEIYLVRNKRFEYGK